MRRGGRLTEVAFGLVHPEVKRHLCVDEALQFVARFEITDECIRLTIQGGFPLAVSGLVDTRDLRKIFLEPMRSVRNLRR